MGQFHHLVRINLSCFLRISDWLALIESEWNRPLFPYVVARDGGVSSRVQLEKRVLRFPNPFKSVRLIFHKDVGLVLFYNALVYTAFNTVIASTPSLFKDIYGLNDLQIGLTYLPFGVASFLAPLINGPLLDWNFQRVAELNGIIIDRHRAQDITKFPLERARFPVALPMSVLGAASLFSYGWAVQAHAPLAVALVLQFIIGITVTGCFQVMNVVVVDYCQLSPHRTIASC